MKYSIGEIARLVSLPTSTLRFYEKEGLIPNIKRTAKGIRMFDEQDLIWIDMIRCLKDTGMSIPDIKNIVDLSLLGDETIETRKNIFLKHKEKIESEMKKLEIYYEKINSKLSWYENKNNKCN